MGDVPIATIQKNRREQFRIALRETRGVQSIDLRVYEDKGKGIVETPKGISIKPDKLQEIIAALVEARDKAGRS